MYSVQGVRTLVLLTKLTCVTMEQCSVRDVLLGTVKYKTYMLMMEIMIETMVSMARKEKTFESKTLVRGQFDTAY